MDACCSSTVSNTSASNSQFYIATRNHMLGHCETTDHMLNSEPRRLLLRGIRIDAFRRNDLLNFLTHAISSGKRALILNHNCHSLYIYKTNRPFREFYWHASHVYVDGLPVVWLARSAGLPLSAEHRITLLDSLDHILSAAAIRGWRVFYLGGRKEVIDQGIKLLRQQTPGLVIDGHHGFFKKTGPESDAVVAQINSFSPDILFVGMGMPIQEIWLSTYYSQLNAAVVMTSGATLEYVTGHSYRPPAWAGPLGLYGVLRLLSNPKRLWVRYLVEPLFLMAMMLPGVILQRLETPRRG
jgi:N-acetylglucosaminyldiphosphoundecaprenol N-acetyl-beta-D-mannosaminyltransferase